MRQDILHIDSFAEFISNLYGIDAVNQGNWSLSIKLRLECYVIVE